MAPGDNDDASGNLTVKASSVVISSGSVPPVLNTRKPVLASQGTVTFSSVCVWLTKSAFSTTRLLANVTLSTQLMNSPVMVISVPGLASGVKLAITTGTSRLRMLFDSMSPSGVFRITFPVSTVGGTLSLMTSGVTDVNASLVTSTPGVKTMAVTLSTLLPINRISSPCLTPEGPKLNNSICELPLSSSSSHAVKNTNESIKHKRPATFPI